MSYTIGVCGSPTSGKTTALRNLKPEETFVITPFKENMPFPGYKKVSKDWKEGNIVKMTNITELPKAIQFVNTNRPEIKNICVEDMSHFFSAYILDENFRKQANDRGKTWSRWADFGAHVYQSLFGLSAYLRDDVYLIHHYHTEVVITAHGESVKIKTPGNMLEKEVNIESYYEVMLYTDVLPIDNNDPKPTSERYRYVTNNDGFYPAKSPLGLFDEMYIPNDMSQVIKRIEEFHNQ